MSYVSQGSGTENKQQDEEKKQIMKFHTKKPLRDTRNHLDKYTDTCLQSQTFLLYPSL